MAGSDGVPEEPPFGAQVKHGEEGPLCNPALLEVGQLQSGAVGIANVFNEILSLIPGSQGQEGGSRRLSRVPLPFLGRRGGVRRQKQKI